MNYATISADVISYTLLTNSEKRRLETEIRKLLDKLTFEYHKQKFYGRLIQGDYIECAMKSPKYALRIALILKTFVKSLDFDLSTKRKIRLKHFTDHGIRLSVAVAPLSELNPKKGIIDGEAIYMSGRSIKRISTSNKQKIVIKNSMFFCSNNTKLQRIMDVTFSLADTIISKYSAKQSEVIFHKLFHKNESEIGAMLNKSQSTISQHSTAAGWISIEKAINYFEKTIK